MAFSVPISSVWSVENHYSNREVDELDEQKVNFKSQPNKEKSYLCILPVVAFAKDPVSTGTCERVAVAIWHIKSEARKRGFEPALIGGPKFIVSFSFSPHY